MYLRSKMAGDSFLQPAGCAGCNMYCVAGCIENPCQALCMVGCETVCTGSRYVP